MTSEQPLVPPSLLGSDLGSVSAAAEQLLLTEAVAQWQLSESEELISLLSEVLQEMCEERERELRRYSREFEQLSGVAGGWRRGQQGNSCNNEQLVQLGNFLWEQLLDLLPTSEDRLVQPLIVNDTFDTQLYFYARIPAPDRRTQKTCQNPLSLMYPANSCYLVDPDWYSTWSTWTDAEPPKVSDKSNDPGPIDNAALVDTWRLKRSLVPYFTVTCLIDTEFLCLLSWYGMSAGSEAVRVGSAETDLYPLTIRSCIYGGAHDHHRIVCIPKNRPMSELVSKIKFVFGLLPDVETRAFIYFDKTKFSHFKDTTQQSNQLFHGQIVQLQRVEPDGTWAERNDIVNSRYSF